MIASPILMVFSLVVFFFGLVLELLAISERSLDPAVGGLLFLGLGIGGVVLAVRRMTGPLATPERARRVAILMTWCIQAGGLYLAFFSHLPQTIAVLVMMAGFAPYVISIKFIEPWLMRDPRRAPPPPARR